MMLFILTYFEFESLFFQALFDVPLHVGKYNPVYKESLTGGKESLESV